MTNSPAMRCLGFLRWKRDNFNAGVPLPGGPTTSDAWCGPGCKEQVPR